VTDDTDTRDEASVSENVTQLQTVDWLALIDDDNDVIRACFRDGREWRFTSIRARDADGHTQGPIVVQPCS